jgi:hypothetical protein
MFRWNWKKVSGIAICLGLTSACSTAPTDTQAYVEQSAPKVYRYEVPTMGTGSIVATCDMLSGNLIYTSMIYQGTSMAVVPGGCKDWKK